MKIRAKRSHRARGGDQYDGYDAAGHVTSILYPSGRKLSVNYTAGHPQNRITAGILQADTYGGYGKIYATWRVEEAACWAHARRPFCDMYENLGRVAVSVADQALQRIAALYAVEAEIRGQPQDVLRRARQARAGPLLEELRAWLAGMVGRVSAKSELAKAIGYSLTRWRALTRYRDDGRIEIDPIERNLALGKSYRIEGVPAVIFEDGSRAPGLGTTAQIQQRLDKVSSR